MKKEVSDHLARVFLETRRTPAPKQKEQPFLLYVVVSGALVAGLILGFNRLSILGKQRNPARQVRILENNGGPYVLRFNFSDALSKIESLSVDIADADLKGYSHMRVAMRLSETDAKLSGPVKISLVNARNESSSRYVADIGAPWKVVEFSLGDFSSVRDWSGGGRFIVTLEPWNVRPKKGSLLIDRIEFVKH